MQLEDNGLKGLSQSLQDFVWLLFYITIAPLPGNFLFYQANAIAVIIFHPLQLFLNSNGSNFNELKPNGTTQYFILAFCQAYFDKLTKFPMLVKNMLLLQVRAHLGTYLRRVSIHLCLNVHARK